MTKELLEILRECKKAGIDKELAQFESGLDGEYRYTINQSNGLEHVFTVHTKKDAVQRDITPDMLLHKPNLTYVCHSIYLDNKCIGSKSAFTPSDYDGFNRSLYSMAKQNLDFVKQIKANTEQTKQILKDLGHE